MFGYEDTDKMIKVLRMLNFINENNIPQVKTRVARELGGGSENLYLTELLMKNVLERLEPEEIVPVLSVGVELFRSSWHRQGARMRSITSSWSCLII